jgi:hypothetical protein
VSELRRRWTDAWPAVLTVAALAASMQAQGGPPGRAASQGSPRGVSQARAEEDKAVAEEAPEPSDARERAARRAKSARYNTGGRDITTLEPGVESFAEHVWPRGEVIPTAESAAVLTGAVVKVQPYLSGDRSRIYTEIEIRVEEVLKGQADGLLPAADSLVIDRLGGALKLGTGRVVRDETHVEGLGKTRVGRRYVFFARRVNEAGDLSLIKSYELRDGKVFTNDSREGKPITALPGVPEAWASEAAFVEAVRHEVTKEVKPSGQ